MSLSVSLSMLSVRAVLFLAPLSHIFSDASDWDLFTRILAGALAGTLTSGLVFVLSVSLSTELLGNSSFASFLTCALAGTFTSSLVLMHSVSLSTFLAAVLSFALLFHIFSELLASGWSHLFRVRFGVRFRVAVGGICNSSFASALTCAFARVITGAFTGVFLVVSKTFPLFFFEIFEAVKVWAEVVHVLVIHEPGKSLVKEGFLLLVLHELIIPEFLLLLSLLLFRLLVRILLLETKLLVSTFIFLLVILLSFLAIFLATMVSSVLVVSFVGFRLLEIFVQERFLLRNILLDSVADSLKLGFRELA